MAKPWPDKAEGYRKMTIEATQRCRFLIDDTRQNLTQTQYEAHANLSELEAIMADVHRWMVLAKNGE